MPLRKILILAAVLSLQGCATMKDLPKSLWGSSTRALENARVDSLSSNFKCSIDECFDAVLAMKRQHSLRVIDTDADDEDQSYAVMKPAPPKPAVVDDGHFEVFLQDRIKSHMVVMGVKGNVDTTEVGIFFSPYGRTSTKVEIASLSSSAKRRVAEVVFQTLRKKFEEKQ